MHIRLCDMQCIVCTTCVFMYMYARVHILIHDDVINWKHFPRYWPFVRGIHRFPVNSLHKGQWRGALMFSLICVWINGWENNREAGDLRHHRALYDVIVMQSKVVRLVPHAGLEDRHFDPRIRKHKLVKQNGVCILYTRFSVPYLNRKISVDVANRVRVLNNIETPYGVIYAGQDCLR